MLEGVRTLADLIDRAAQEWPDKEAIIFKDQRIIYREVQYKANRLGQGFLKIGIKKGDKIAIWLSNIPEFVYTEFAVFKIGATMVPLNTRFKAPEMEYILKQSDSTTLVMLDNFLGLDFIEMIREVCPEISHCRPGELKSERLPLLKNVICVSKKKYDGMFNYDEILGWESDPQVEDEIKRTQASVEPDDIANTPYTSGTTGFPKGVMTTHHQYVRQVQDTGERVGIKEGDRINGGPPFCFNFGNILGPLMCFMFGGTLIPLEYWDPEEALRLIQDEKCTHFTGAPTMYTMMMGRPGFGKYDLSSLRTGLISAAPAPVQLIKDSLEKMGFENLTSGYGMTENSGATSLTVYGDPPEIVSTTVGKPLPDVEVKVVDPNTGKDLPPGEQGELCTRGYIIMKGYYKMPEETAETTDKDGWFHTKDLVTIDEDGYIKITGRLKDMFISGGTNVYPVEVENFLFTHPKVSQVSVVGVPDERMGEVGMAFIIPKEGESSTAEEIIEYCKGKIANYKIPKYVEFVKEFPLNPMGKIMKFKLQDLGKEIIKS